MESNKLIEAMARAMADNLGIRSWEDTPVDRGDLRRRIRDRENYDVNEPNQWDYLDAATAALKALRDTLGYDPQAAFNAGLERAAVIASKEAQGWLNIGTSKAASNMTAAKYKARHQAGGEIVAKIRAEKEKPQ